MNAKTLCLLLIIATLTQCSILKKEDPEKDVRAFLETFQASLAKSDDEIFQLFKVAQSKEALLSIIDVLQNEDPFIVCDANYTGAKITFNKEFITIEIPATFSVKGLDSNETKMSSLILKLAKKNNAYNIVQIEGETFYEEFAQLKNMHSWEADQKLALQEREPIYTLARQLETKFDSVIWYTQYLDKNYFYVVEGKWNNFFINLEDSSRNLDVKMGLVDELGNIVIPIGYGLVGTPGFDFPNIVEITNNDKVGYFDIASKKVIVEPQFDFIVPYHVGNTFAIVKQDSSYGWLDRGYKFTSGFPNGKAKQWIMDFQFLQQPFALKVGQYSFCEIPNSDHTGNGIIIPPSYLSYFKIFDEIESGISTTKTPIHGWSEYKETSGWSFQMVSETISALVTTVKQRYLEGREEFYVSNQLLFVDANHNTIGSGKISGEQISVRSIDSTMLEVITPQDYWFEEYDVAEELNLSNYHYFSIGTDGSVAELKSMRYFVQTEFAKIDSSYLSGVFDVYNVERSERQQKYFLSLRTITYMRDEILAVHGLIFTEPEKQEKFKELFQDNYRPQFNSVDDFRDQLTDVERHNLDFLNRVLEKMSEEESGTAKAKV
jgi:hypothetical protein